MYLIISFLGVDEGLKRLARGGACSYRHTSLCDDESSSAKSRPYLLESTAVLNLDLVRDADVDRDLPVPA